MRNFFGYYIPEIHEILSVEKCRNFIALALGRFLRELGTPDEEIGDVVHQLLYLAINVPDLPDYERMVHDLLVSRTSSHAMRAAILTRARRIAAQVKPHLLPGVTFDCGCGDGGVARLLRDGGHGEVWGGDIWESEEAVRKCSKFVKLEDHSALPLRSKFFDNTLLCTVLHHAGNPLRLLREAVRITKPSGRIIIIESVHGVHAEAGELERSFSDLPDEFQLFSNIFFDHLYNRCLCYSGDVGTKIPVPFNFLTSRQWNALAREVGGREVKRLVFGLDQPLNALYHSLSILLPTVPGKLAEQLTDIEADRRLKELVRQGIVGAVQQRDDQAYVRSIREGLDILAAEYLVPWMRVRRRSLSFCFLVSYHSKREVSRSASPLGERIMSLMPQHPLVCGGSRSAVRRKSMDLAAHVGLIVSEVFHRIWDQQPFSLHDYAREELIRIASNNGRAVRSRGPVYIEQRQGEWNFDVDINGPQVIITIPDKVDDFDQAARSFAELLNRPFISSRLAAPKPIGSEEVRMYLAYLVLLLRCRLTEEALRRIRELFQASDLGFGELMDRLVRHHEGKAITLCAMPVSDELSNMDLGTILLFYEGDWERSSRAETIWQVEEQCFEFMDAVWKVERIEEAKMEGKESQAVMAGHEVGAQLVFVETLLDGAYKGTLGDLPYNLVQGSLQYSHLFLEERSRYIPGHLWVPWGEEDSGKGAVRVRDWLDELLDVSWKIALSRESRNLDYAQFLAHQDVFRRLSRFPGELSFSLPPSDPSFIPPPGDFLDSSAAAWGLVRWFLAAASNALAWASSTSPTEKGLDRLRCWSVAGVACTVRIQLKKDEGGQGFLGIHNGCKFAPYGYNGGKSRGTYSVLNSVALRIPGARTVFRPMNDEEVKQMLPGERHGFTATLRMPWALMD